MLFGVLFLLSLVIMLSASRSSHLAPYINSLLPACLAAQQELLKFPLSLALNHGAGADYGRETGRNHSSMKVIRTLTIGRGRPKHQKVAFLIPPKGLYLNSRILAKPSYKFPSTISRAD